MRSDDGYPAKAVLACCLASKFPQRFADDVRTPCADCGRDVWHRPYVPERVVKVCLGCVQKRVAAETANGTPVEIGITRRAATEFKLYTQAKGTKQ